MICKLVHCDHGVVRFDTGSSTCAQNFNISSTLALSPCLFSNAWERYSVENTMYRFLLKIWCRKITVRGKWWLICVCPPWAAACSFVNNVIAYANLCNVACMLLVKKEVILYLVWSCSCSINVRFSTYSSYTCGLDRISNQWVLTYFKRDMFESWVKRIFPYLFLQIYHLLYRSPKRYLRPVLMMWAYTLWRNHATIWPSKRGMK